MKQLIVTFLVLTGLSISALAEPIRDCRAYCPGDYSSAAPFGADQQYTPEYYGRMEGPSLGYDRSGPAGPPPGPYMYHDEFASPYSGDPDGDMPRYDEYADPFDPYWDHGSAPVACIPNNPDSAYAWPGVDEDCLT